MKNIFLAIFVLLAAQPLQASLCDMSDVLGSSQAQHGNMDNMNCCETDPTESANTCGPVAQCGACAVGVATVRIMSTDIAFTANTHLLLPAAGEPVSRFKSPPFRPPIS